MQQDLHNRTVLGIIEPIAFPELGVVEVLAKIDTGAYSGAIHCEVIEEVIHPETGKKALKVVPIDESHKPVIIDKYSKVVAISSTGHRNQRYIATTKIVIDGKEYSIRIGLTKRTIMNMKVLIGRRFLRENAILVDVTHNQELDNDGGRK